MTPLQTAELRAGSIRIRLSELAAETELTPEHRSELDALRTEYGDTERRMAALRISEPDRTPIETRTAEGTEYRAILARANVGNVYDALLNHRAVSGPEAELQQHLGLAGNQIPLDLLRGAGRGDGGNGGMEYRAVTPGATNVGQVEQPVIPYVFPQSAAAFLGVDMPTVGVGEVVYPVLTATLSVEALAEATAGTETTGRIFQRRADAQAVAGQLFLLQGGPGANVHAGLQPTREPGGRAGGRAGQGNHPQHVAGGNEPAQQQPDHQ